MLARRRERSGQPSIPEEKEGVKVLETNVYWVELFSTVLGIASAACVISVIVTFVSTICALCSDEKDQVQFARRALCVSVPLLVLAAAALIFVPSKATARAMFGIKDPESWAATMERIEKKIDAIAPSK
jgi:cytochrome bd-type quinol oxidase subunit 1